MPVQSRRWRPGLLAGLLGIAVAAIVGGLLAASVTGSGTPSRHPGGVARTGGVAGAPPADAPSEQYPATSPVTAISQALLDRQPPVGRGSTVVPSARTGPSGVILNIPAIGVRASVVPEGIDQTPGDVGNLAVPVAADQVGWWDGGPVPGQPGVAVLAGHRISGFAFWKLPDLHAGDAILVTGANGQTTTWSVTHVQQLLKTQLPGTIWTKGGPPQVALVTCGGPYNDTTGHYDDNIIVWASRQ